MIQVGDNIYQEKTKWTFEGDVANTFYNHILKSIMLYQEGHELVCKLSEFFCKQDSVCYDLGTSTGELLIKLARYNKNKPNIRWIGIDSVPNMIQKASDNLLNYAGISNVEFVTSNIENYVFEKSDFVVSSYTLQFIPIRSRVHLLKRIYESLNEGGAFIMFEKIYNEVALFQDIFRSIYSDFKLENGFSSEEVINKEQSIRGVLNPLSTNKNIELLEQSGFKSVTVAMKYCCFEGYLAVK